MGRLQNPQLSCFDIKPVNPNQENNKIDEKVAKFIDLENKKMFLIQELLHYLETVRLGITVLLKAIVHSQPLVIE